MRTEVAYFFVYVGKEVNGQNKSGYSREGKCWKPIKNFHDSNETVILYLK